MVLLNRRLAVSFEQYGAEVRCLISRCLLTDWMNLLTNFGALSFKRYVGISKRFTQRSRNRFATRNDVVFDPVIAFVCWE